MMNKIILLLLVSCFIGCNSPNPITSKKVNIPAIKDSINGVINHWHKAATEANFENYFNIMDSVSVFIGTDASEVWSKKEFMTFSKPYFDKGKAWSFKPLNRTIYTNKNGNFAWFDELLETWMGTCRGSGVLEKKNELWKIKHYVLSVSIPNDDIYKIIAVKKEKDSIFLQKLDSITNSN